MDITKFANDLLSVVNPNAFISKENVGKLQKLSSEQRREMYDVVNDNDPLGKFSMYKVAYQFGKNKFKKEAESLMIWKGVQEYEKIAGKKKVPSARELKRQAESVLKDLDGAGSRIHASNAQTAQGMQALNNKVDQTISKGVPKPPKIGGVGKSLALGGAAGLGALGLAYAGHRFYKGKGRRK